MEPKIKVLTEEQVSQYNYLPIKYYVYLITNLLNGKIYVGARHTKRKSIKNDNYWGSGARIKLAIKKYGKENFKKEIIAVFDNECDMYSLEESIVNVEFLQRDDVYNIAIGGNIFTEGGKSATGRIYIKNEKLKLNKLVFPNSEECKELLKNGWEIGRYITDTHIKSIRETHLGNKIWEGRHHTDETKAKMREKAVGRPKSEEAKMKMRFAWATYRTTENMGHEVTQEQREYLSSLWKGCVWLKNEELKLQRQIKPNSDEYKKLIKEGWVVGQLKKELKWVWLKNVITRKEECIDKNAIDTINSLLNSGWEYGRIRCYNKEYREWANKNGFKRVWVSNNELKLSTRVYKGTDEYNKMINNGWVDGRTNYTPKNKLIK